MIPFFDRSSETDDRQTQYISLVTRLSTLSDHIYTILYKLKSILYNNTRKNMSEKLTQIRRVKTDLNIDCQYMNYINT